MTPLKKIVVQDIDISISQDSKREDYMSLTDLMRAKDGEFFITDWLRNKNTLEYLEAWESLNNENFNYGEFALIKNQAGLNRFKISVKEWCAKTNAIGITAKAGRYGGTYAHKDIAFHFCMWISPQFQLYVVKEYQRLKEAESNPLLGEWNVKRMLSKANYTIHTDAVKDYVVPNLPDRRKPFAYASEADLLNIALWGVTASQWREANAGAGGQNIRDMASINELIVLSNMESYNAELTRQGIEPNERLERLRDMAQRQMKSLDSNNIEQKFRALEVAEMSNKR